MRLILLILLLCQSLTVLCGTRDHIYQAAEESYRYTVAETGENYTFKFDRSPGDIPAKLLAGYQVLRQIYRDDSIHRRYSEHYIKERARCYVFDSHFYTYSLCFLPNDFNRSESERFWGFATRIPNWLWLLTRILLPVLTGFGLLFYFTKAKQG
ncbi:hypothetical protein [Methylomarinum vadi]|uniref:hypothetical protein n=1 Tax=Methylomarinum vadi TaxID=438855 RepID=UPI0004DFCD7A|nr:hypothetical protein [Methylomarinum vadi]